MRKLLLGAATIVTSLGVTAGVAAAQTAISNVGPDSDATVTSEQTTGKTVATNNDLNVENNHDATANSGAARNTDNNTGGGATTGNASNASDFGADLSVDTSASTGGMGASDTVVTPAGDVSIDGVGPNSSASVKTTVNNMSSVEANNDINVENNLTQHATTGNATVSGNNTGGSAATGSASNTSTSSVKLSVTQ